jgi:hypothetical protein
MAPLLLAAGLLATVMACRGNDNVSPTATVDLSNVTVDQAYARMTQAMTREGQVLHTRVHLSSEQGSDRELRPYSTTELWIDTAAGALREEFRLDPSVDAYDVATKSTLIVVDRYVFAPDSPDKALRSDVKFFCPQNSDPLISYLLECGELPLQQESAATRTRFDAGREYKGHPAAALVFELDGEVFQGTFTTYVDPVTFLPMARTAEPTSGGGFPRSVAEYEHEFVDAASRDPSLFDPHSIGYGAKDAQATLDAIAKDVPVHWLGEEFNPGGSWPELVLVRLFKDDRGYFKAEWGAGGHLIYETPNGGKGVDIFLWKPADFDMFMRSEAGAVLDDPLCVERSALSVDDTEVPLYAIPWPEPPVNTAPQTPEEACPIRVVNALLHQFSYIAIVRMADVVVDVRADVQGDFRSAEAMKLLVQAVRAR